MTRTITERLDNDGHGLKQLRDLTATLPPRKKRDAHFYKLYPTIALFTTNDRNEEKYITTKLAIGNRTHRAILDTGADVSLCTPLMANDTAFKAFEWSTTDLLLPDGNKIPVSGAVQGVVRYGETELTTIFVVAPPTLPEAAVLGGITLIAINNMLGPAQLQYDLKRGFAIHYDQEATSSKKQKKVIKDLEPRTFNVPDYVTSDTAIHLTRMHIAGRIRGMKAVGRWDTGAPRSICRATTAFKYGIKKISSEAPAFHFLNGRLVSSLGLASVHFETAHVTSGIDVLVIPDAEYNGNDDILLGLDWTAEAAKRCNFTFDIGRKELFLDGIDIAVKHNGQAKIYSQGYIRPPTPNDPRDTKAPTRKRTRSYTNLSRSMKREEQTSGESAKQNLQTEEQRRNVERQERETNQPEQPSNAETALQLLTEASNAIEQMSQRLDAAYQVGERLLAERNEERRMKEEWKNQAVQAEKATAYWSQGFADLSTKVREVLEERHNTSARDATEENKLATTVQVSARETTEMHDRNDAHGNPNEAQNA